MKVNAQVTAVTSIIEVFGNVLQWTIWIFITKFAGHGTLIQSILLYFVFLPYAFLMNTSENKNRIVEDGWLNVLKNVFIAGHHHLVSVGNKLQNKHRTRVNQISSSPNECANISNSKIKHSPEELPVSSNDSAYTNNNDNGIEIFTMFGAKSPVTSAEEHDDIVTINVPMELQPCSSKSADWYYVENRKNKDPKLENESEWNNVRYEMINDLLSSSDEEHIYVENFKWLLRFEDASKTKIENLELFKERMKTKKYCAIHNNKVDVQSRQVNVSTRHMYLDMESNESVTNNLKFRGYFQNRLNMRIEMILRLLKHCKDNENDVYNDILEIFVDMEEDFIDPN